MMRPPKDESEIRKELRESELERKVEEQQTVHNAVPLETLVPDDASLREAMEYFLLAAPDRQLEQLGEPSALKKTADEAMNSGDRLSARIAYESAAKIELYMQNKEEFNRLLTLAEKATPPGGRFKELHRVLLDKIDRAMQVAKDYYASFVDGAIDKPKVLS